jgi:hypothetical protein
MIWNACRSAPGSPRRLPTLAHRTCGPNIHDAGISADAASDVQRPHANRWHLPSWPPGHGHKGKSAPLRLSGHETPGRGGWWATRPGSGLTAAPSTTERPGLTECDLAPARCARLINRGVRNRRMLAPAAPFGQRRGGNRDSGGPRGKGLRGVPRGPACRMVAASARRVN